MKRTRRARMFLAATGLLLAPLWACAGPAGERLSGRYGHDYTQSAGDPVWVVSQDADGWHALTPGDGELSDAYRIAPAARAAFWDAMAWPADTAAAADCLSWGERMPTLSDLLDEKPPPSDPQETYGSSVLCHVPSEARAGIDTLADQASDWFYYDPMLGLMQINRLGADENRQPAASP